MDQEIRRAITRIDVAVGGRTVSRGTGTLVTDSLVLTALHVVADRTTDPVVPYNGTITLTFPSHATPASIYGTYVDADGDWALLECDEPPPGVKPAPLAELSTSGGQFQTYGFPDAQPLDGMVQTGTVENYRGTLFDQSAMQLFSKQAAGGEGAPVKGLSGAPVIVDNAVVGVLRFALMQQGKAVAGTLYACPISTIKTRCDFLAVESAAPRARQRAARERERPHVLRASLGRLHRAWMQRPTRAAGFAFLWYVAVAAASLVLGIHTEFPAPPSDVGESLARGFYTELYWGPLYLVAVPLSAYLVGWLLEVIDGALDSLDHVLTPGVPDADGGPMFTTYLAGRLPVPLRRIAVLALILAAGITLVADYSFILAPAEFEWVEPSEIHAWSTRGFEGHPGVAAPFYLLFNIGAFAMQAFLIYCGFYIALSLSYILLLVNKQESGAEGDSFLFTWDYSDQTGRCGLHQFDRVYILFILSFLISMILGGVSLGTQVYAGAHGIDAGLKVMVFCFVIVIPIAFAMIIIPYWKGFPRSVPKHVINQGYPEPKPWPLGADNLAWGMILVTVGFVALLAYLLFTGEFWADGTG